MILIRSSTGFKWVKNVHYAASSANHHCLRLSRQFSTNTTSFALHDYKVATIVQRRTSNPIPPNGIGQLLIKRSKLVDEIVALIISGRKNPTVGVTGPMGSGKSQLLKLVGQKLLSHGDVYWFTQPNDIDKIKSCEIKALNSALEDQGKKAFILIDEIQQWKGGNGPILAKGQCWNLGIIGFGVPRPEESYRFFFERFRESDMRLTWNDITEGDNTILWFTKQLMEGSDCADTVTARDATEGLLHFLLLYTGGHVYTMLKLAAMMVAQHKEACFNGNYMRVLGSRAYYDSEVHSEIKNRVFPDNSLLRSAVDMMVGGWPDHRAWETEREHHVREVQKRGFWDCKTHNFCSDFFASAALVSRARPPLLATTTFGTIEELLQHALGLIDMEFFRYCSKTRPTFLSDALAFWMTEVSDVTVSSQHIMDTLKSLSNLTKKPRDCPPTSDLYINGDFDCFVKVLFNGFQLDECFQQILRGSHQQASAKCVVLDIELQKEKPRMPSVPELLYREQADNHYTYIPSTKTLYKGGKMRVIDSVIKNCTLVR